MGQIVVSISAMHWSTRPDDVLVTYSLGSCIGVSAYDPQTRVGGLIHCLLPNGNVSPDKARANPHMFVSTGVVDMVKTLLRHGASRERLIIKAAGGAKMMQVNNMFDVGSRNATTLEKLLAHNNMKLAGRDFGGSIPRTMSLQLDTGTVMIKSLGSERVL